MVILVVFNATMMFAYVVTILFCMGDFEIVATSLFPLLEVYHQATSSKKAALTMLILQSVVGLVALFNMFASVSRPTWAFARGKGLPCSTFFSKVRPSGFDA